MFGAEICWKRIWQTNSSRADSILQRTIRRKKIIYSARDENIASNRLAESFGFLMISSVAKIDSKDGHHYNLLQYSLKL